MTPTHTRKPAPYHRFALLAFALAIIAAGVAHYGSVLSETHIPDTPQNRLRGSEGLGATGPSRFWIPFAAFIVPLALGLAAAFMGGAAMRAIERDKGTTSGSGAAVFAIMIGGLSAVIAGCMIFVVYGWKYVPTLYTY
jgi:nitric oxide reductase large subunit